MSRNSADGYPRSPQWSTDSDDSLSNLSPYMFPPTATPPRPGVSNLRKQPEQNRFFPQHGQQITDVPKLPPVFRPDGPRKNASMGLSSPKIVTLNRDNFQQFVAPMEKVLVYFYNSDGNRHTPLESQFSEAADRMNHPGYGFGAVDCALEQAVCHHFQITQPAVLKLFSYGYDLSTINSPMNFSADEMQRLVSMSPVLRKPRAEEGKNFIKKKQQAQYG
ncbi:unnamed protein product [Candidula unifasciata]|uniref:Uncharacterized protein n=1 Tax=Candidula unifasciata TaxID=100452 RepID=A0A8S4A1V0_9EUPU|nr:unnamed protein product [Candidula unifasciata]